jgi:hypothetical protein
VNDLLHEQVIPMPPVSLGVLERVAQHVIAELFPGETIGPGDFDVLRLVDEVLPNKHGIDVYPVSQVELGWGCEGATDWESNPITIRILEEQWHALAEGGRRANRARSTVVHELAHVILHVQFLRDAQKVQTREALLNRRTPRGSLKPFVDPEWQAHALCGAILAPRRHIEDLMAKGYGVDAMADALKVSTAFLASRLRRLRIELK